MSPGILPGARALVACALALGLGACGGLIATDRGQNCTKLVRIAQKEMADAEAKGLGGRVQILKAANLIVLVNLQIQFEEFDNCEDRIHRARIYIREAQKE